MYKALLHPLTAPLRFVGVALAVFLATIPAEAQTKRRTQPAGSGVPAAALPVARAQPNKSRDLAILTSATPMALPNGEASGGPGPAAASPSANDLDPRVFRVDPRDEIVIVTPLNAPPVDYGNGVVVAPRPAAGEGSGRSPVASDQDGVSDSRSVPPRNTKSNLPSATATATASATASASGTDPRPLTTDHSSPAPSEPPARPDPELDKRSAQRSRAKAVRDGTVASLAPNDLMEYSRQPARVKHVIKNALALTDLGLGYKFGSADASRGGMDCSGAIFATLNNAGMHGHPRDSFSQYEWLVEHGKFNTARAGGFGKFSLEKLKPGDLLFWVNTYKTSRNPPVTHVAIYLGREKRTGRHVMMHAGGGRKYNGKSRRGVTVANLEYPDKIGMRGGKGSFIGWGSIPGVR